MVCLLILVYFGHVFVSLCKGRRWELNIDGRGGHRHEEMDIIGFVVLSSNCWAEEMCCCSVCRYSCSSCKGLPR